MVHWKPSILTMNSPRSVEIDNMRGKTKTSKPFNASLVLKYMHVSFTIYTVSLTVNHLSKKIANKV